VSDRVLGAGMLLLALAYGLEARTFESGLLVAMDPLGASMFPYLLAVVLGITGVYMILRPDPSPEWPDLRHLGEMAGVVLVLTVYVVMLEEVGFIIATFAAVAFIGWRLSAPPLTALANGLATSVVLYVLFDRLLGLPLPLGPLDLVI
jgi:putative tricarboxylic transport membrane protein